MEIAVIPYRFLEIFTARKDLQIHINIAMSSFLLLAVLATPEIRASIFSLPHTCLLMAAFETPCPGCGIISSFLAMLRFDLIRANAENPIGPFLFMFYLLQIPARLAALNVERFGRLVNGGSTFGGRLILTGLLVVWALRLMSNGGRI